jgi:hypothetical protein
MLVHTYNPETQVVINKDTAEYLRRLARQSEPAIWSYAKDGDREGAALINAHCTALYTAAAIVESNIAAE